jgi:hypothetical protein
LHERPLGLACAHAAVERACTSHRLRRTLERDWPRNRGPLIPSLIREYTNRLLLLLRALLDPMSLRTFEV